MSKPPLETRIVLTCLPGWDLGVHRDLLREGDEVILLCGGRGYREVS